MELVRVVFQHRGHKGNTEVHREFLRLDALKLENSSVNLCVSFVPSVLKNDSQPADFSAANFKTPLTKLLIAQPCGAAQ